MNRELLARVRDRIAEVGNEHCDMDDYNLGGPMVGEGEPACGTTACIAGHAMAIHHGRFDWDEWNQDHHGPGSDGEDAAVALLGLPNSNLFYVGAWPCRFEALAGDEGDAKGMLAVCDALLDGALVFDAEGALRESDV